MKLLHVFLLLAMALVSGATEYYVDFTDGADANSGLATNLAKKSIPAMSPGDTAWLKAGSIRTNIDGLYYTSDGTILWTSTNCAIAADGRTITSTDTGCEAFSAGHRVVIAGEGLFTVSNVVDTSSFKLTTLTRHGAVASNVAVSVFNPVTIAVKTNWGTGPTILSNRITLTGVSGIIVDGTVSNGLEMICTIQGPTTQNTEEAPASTVVLRNLHVHGGITNGPCIYMQYVQWALIESCRLETNGNFDAAPNDDGISLASYTPFATIQHCWLNELGDDGIHFNNMDRSYIQYNHISRVWSGGAHSDAIACNALGSHPFVIIRCNEIVDCASPNDLEDLHFRFINNVFWNSVPYPTDSLGNNAVRIGRRAYGEVWNNTFAYNSGAAIYQYDFAYETNSDFRNNLFWENSDSSVGDYDQPEVQVYWTNNLVLNNNYYRRAEFRSPTNLVILNLLGRSWAQLQALGYEANGIVDTNFSTQVITTTNRATMDFRIPAGSPLIGAGQDMSAYFTTDFTGATRSTWDIGAYEHSGEPAPATGRTLRAGSIRAGTIRGP